MQSTTICNGFLGVTVSQLKTKDSEPLMRASIREFADENCNKRQATAR